MKTISIETIKQMSKQVIVLDNPDTFDRYTIIVKKTSDMYGASFNPFNPQGFGQYCMNIATDMYKWNVNKIKFNKLAVSIYTKDCSNVGKRIRLNKLPNEVLVYIEQILTEC